MQCSGKAHRRMLSLYFTRTVSHLLRVLQAASTGCTQLTEVWQCFLHARNKPCTARVLF